MNEYPNIFVRKNRSQMNIQIHSPKKKSTNILAKNILVQIYLNIFEYPNIRPTLFQTPKASTCKRMMNRDEMEEVRHKEYLERQERVFERKQENWRLNALRGKTCMMEQCGKNFSDTNEFYAHLEKHKAEMRRRLVCTQDK